MSTDTFSPVKAPSAYRGAVPVEGKRAAYIKAMDSNKRAPSIQGQTHEFSIQADTKVQVQWGRPPSASPTIPVTLLNNIFREFIDDCSNVQPTSKDNALVRELVEEMCPFHDNEVCRQLKFIEILERYGIQISATSITGTKYTTDGDLFRAGHRPSIWEIKNDLGWSGAEPFCQGILYFYHSTKNDALAKPTFSFPCILGVLFGELLHKLSGHLSIK